MSRVLPSAQEVGGMSQQINFLQVGHPALPGQGVRASRFDPDDRWWKSLYDFVMKHTQGCLTQYVRTPPEEAIPSSCFPGGRTFVRWAGRRKTEIFGHIRCPDGLVIAFSTACGRDDIALRKTWLILMAGFLAEWRKPPPALALALPVLRAA